MNDEKVREACKTVYLKEYNSLLEELLEIFGMYRDFIAKDENLPKSTRELVKGKSKVTYCKFFRALLVDFYDQPAMQKYIINYKKAKTLFAENLSQESDLNNKE